MELRVVLALPRDQLSVPVARRLLTQSMRTLGVDEDTTSDIEIALTEACTNVLDHAADGQEYEVSAGIHGDTCIIRVVDRGSGGFDGETHGLSEADAGAESGRGIQIMRALVDEVKFESRPSDGTVVQLEKHIAWSEDSVASRLAEGTRT